MPFEYALQIPPYPLDPWTAYLYYLFYLLFPPFALFILYQIWKCFYRTNELLEQLIEDEAD